MPHGPVAGCFRDRQSQTGPVGLVCAAPFDEAEPLLLRERYGYARPSGYHRIAARFLYTLQVARLPDPEPDDAVGQWRIRVGHLLARQSFQWVGPPGLKVAS
ncbi:MAG: hypothetical protein KDA27_27505 [Candidatus Eisenbacteria bacterium]|uniref:Uncharacterized protein n=1 Tax=Eiseniibacteriota bacterium TaxID=2212470 RepID=A0A956NKP4_UNCEI|nr:hypothetical protein [Candidatus Eisenbacteria bacterium]